MSASLALTLALSILGTTDLDRRAPIPAAPAETTMLREAVIHHLLTRVDALDTNEQLGLYLGAFPSATRRAFTVHRLRYSSEHVAEDPALEQLLPRIENAWLRPSLEGEIPMAARLLETKVMVARNLHMRGENASEASVRRELERLASTRRALENEHLFAGRQVVFTASSERLPDGRPVFGRAASRHVLANQAEELFTLVPGHRDVDGRQLEWLMTRAPKVTLVFEGHSDGSSLKLPLGALEIPRLAGWLAARSPHLPAPILVLDTCYGHDFARRLIAALEIQDTGARRPLIVIPEEFGLPRIKEVFGAGLLRGVLYGNSSRPASAGAILRSYDRRLSLYAADAENRMMHVG